MAVVESKAAQAAQRWQSNVSQAYWGVAHGGLGLQPWQAQQQSNGYLKRHTVLLQTICSEPLHAHTGEQ